MTFKKRDDYLLLWNGHSIFPTRSQHNWFLMALVGFTCATERACFISFCKKKFIYLFWQQWVLVMACDIFFSCSMWDLVPWPGSNPGPLHWELGVLATEPPGKSGELIFWMNTMAGQWQWTLGGEGVREIRLGIAVWITYAPLSGPHALNWHPLLSNPQT